MNSIGAGSVFGTSFDGPEVDSNGFGTSALAQARSQFGSGVVDIIETGLLLNYFMYEKNSFDPPVKPASVSDTDWEWWVGKFGNWFCYSVRITSGNPTFAALASEAAYLKMAEKPPYGYKVKVYNEMLAHILQGMGG